MGDHHMAAEQEKNSENVVPLKKSRAGRRSAIRHENPLQTLRYWVEVVGVPQIEIARVLGVSQQNLCDQINNRRPLSDSLLEYLGWERVTEYRRIHTGERCPDWSTTDDQPDA